MKANHNLERSSSLKSLDPILDSSGLLRIGGRQEALEKPYDKIQPIILIGKHPITKLIIRAEHLRLMHAGPTLVHASLSRRIHIIGVSDTRAKQMFESWRAMSVKAEELNCAISND